MGCPPGTNDGISAIINLQYSAMLSAAEIFTLFEHVHEAKTCRDRAAVINQYVNAHCWDEKRGVYLDCASEPDKISELGNAWAILADAATGERLTRAGQAIYTHENLAKATLYGRFYVFRALKKANLYNNASKLLDVWYQMMDYDLTTWPEEPRLGRSYCHAWSATPIYEFLAEILGVTPREPGFSAVCIQPQLMDLTWAKGTVPIPQGKIHVEWQRDDTRFKITVTCPPKLPVTLILPDGTAENFISNNTPLTRECMMKRTPSAIKKPIASLQRHLLDN